MNNNIFLNKLVIQFLLICSLLAWGVKTLAVEPSITLAKGISLLLRDDGVLIQLGGYPSLPAFTPLILEDTVMPPIQSQGVVLTQIERMELQDGLYDGNNDKEDSVIAYGINGDVFIWTPIFDYGIPQLQPKGKVEGLSSVKKILMNSTRPSLALTQTHAVFSFGGFRNIPLSPLTELNDVKTLVLERQGYRVLTSKGSLLSASIDENRVYYTTPTPLTDESGTVITHLSQLSDFYKPYQSSLLTQEGYTYLINWMDDYPNRIYKNRVWLVKDEQGNPIPNITRISRGFTSFFAFTEEGTAYVWQSNFGSSTYSPAYLIKDKQGVALSPVIDAVFGGEAKYFMLTANGQLYFVKHEPFKNFSPSPPPDAPSAATLVHDLEGNILSNVNALNSRFITTEAGEVYFKLDEVEGVDFRVQKIEGLEDIKYFEDIKHFDLIQSEKVYLFLTHGGDVYSWDQDNPVKPLPGLSDVVTLRVTPYHPRSDTVKLPHYLALKADGSVCGGGDNTLGQLGTEAPAWVPINEPICGIEQLIVNPQPATLTIETTGPGQITSIPAGIACSNDHCQYNYSNPTFVTLTATPETDYRLKKWADDCQVYGRQQQIKVLVEAATHCSAVFELAGEPHLIVEPQSHHFFNVPVGTSLAYTFMLHNSGDSALELGQISVDQSAFKLQEHCSQTQLAPLAECPLTLQFQPQTVADDQTATVTIPSNDPQQPTLTLSLRGSSCSGEPQLQTITMTPQQLDFGTEFIGKHLSLKQKVHAVIEGCGAIVPSTFELTGADAGEFKLEHQNCYQGQYEEKAYFSCLYDLIFSPTTVGDKNAELKISLSEQQLPPLITPLKAKAVDSAQAIVEITPTQHDFGQVVIGRELRSQKFVVHNKGHISLKLTPFTLTGDTDFFLKTDRCRYQSPLHPGESCTVEVGFKPLSAAPQKQAQLILNDNNSVILSGSAEKAADCAQPTIESVASGAWEQASHWQPARIPTTTDIVRIQKPHTLTAPTVITVKALCIEGQLHSPDNGDSLTIQVRDYLENQGSIIGRTGADEPQDCTESCAQPGASLFVEMTYEAWAPDASIAIVNKGQIVAGNGGSGRLLGAAGGNLMISSQLIHNEGTLQAGQGGHLTGTETGSAGPGGTIQIQSYGQFFNQAGAQVQAGDGGNCHPQATAVQTGGNGGDLNLMDTDLVNLQGGQFSAGQAGQACNHNRGGDVLMDPGLLTVAQAHIHGEQVMLYGGQDWLLNLTDINQPNITATQAITLAVDDGGVIDLRGNHGILFNTPGQVNMFTDTLLLDEDQILDDLIQADNIVIGPSQTVRQVALINAGKVSATAGEALTVEFILVNNSPQPEHFALAATDTEGWLIHSVPATVELEALSSVKLALTLSLPAQSLATDVITVHAASLSAPEIKAVATMNIEATASEELLIELVQLVAIPQGNQIHLKWITQAEKNHAGFRFWRAIQDQQGHYREVTLLAPATPSQTHLLPVTSGDSNVLIPAQGSLVDLRCYHVVDASVEVGKTYFYLLEDISTAGIHTLHWDNIAVATVGIEDNTNFIDFEGYTVGADLRVCP